MSTTGIWLPNWKLTTYTKPAILPGNLKWGITGKIVTPGSELSTPPITTTISILATPADLSSRLSPIDVTEPYAEHLAWTTEVHPKALLEQEKPKQSKIWPKPSPDSAWCSTAQMVLTTGLWVNSSKDWPHQVPGHVSISSTESTLRCCLWLPSRFWPSLSPENRVKRFSSSRMPISPSKLPATSSSQWTLGTLEGQNFPITWRLSSEQWLWWCPTTLWLPRFPSTLSASTTPATSLEKSQQPTPSALSNSHPKTTTTTAWGQLNLSSQPQEISKENFPMKTSRFWCWEPSTMSI